MNKSVYQLLKEMCEIGSDYEEDFINWCFDNICRPDCNVECNNYYVEGPEIKNILGCFVNKYTEKEAYTILNTIKQRVDANYCWEGEWKNII